MKARFSISVVRGESLRDTPRASEIIARDRQNMGDVLRAVGLSFPEERRLLGLFHPSNRIVLAEREH
jgi:hypothetical protein